MRSFKRQEGAFGALMRGMSGSRSAGEGESQVSLSGQDGGSVELITAGITPVCRRRRGDLGRTAHSHNVRAHLTSPHLRSVPLP